MDTRLTPEQDQLGQVAREFFSDHSPLSAVRLLEETDAGFSSDTWKAMTELGWLGIGHDELDGGSNGGVMELTMIYQEMGRSLAITPHLPSVVIGLGLLEGAVEDTSVLQRSLLTGASIATPVLYGADGDYRIGAGVAGVGNPDGTFTLNGAGIMVPFANSADILIVAARDASNATDDLLLFVLDVVTPGIELKRMPNIANYPLYELTFDSVVAPSLSALRSREETNRELVRNVLARATVLRCAEVFGSAEQLLEMSLDYAKTRHQFGKPVGSFQAVQYLCSDIVLASHVTMLHTRYAAGLIDANLPADAAVAMAKAQACRCARVAPDRTHQVHAGIAFMMEHDTQLFTRRTRYWEVDLGDERHHLDAITSFLKEKRAQATT